MRDSTELPDLRMLPVADLRPHEDFDPRRLERLSQRLQAERTLKNPPVIAGMPPQTFERAMHAIQGANLVASTLGVARLAIGRDQAAAYIVRSGA